MLALWACAWVSFVSAETVVIIAFSGIPNEGAFSRYIVPFLVSLPMVAGVKGYYDVPRRVIDNGEGLIPALSRQFLLTIIVSYSAVTACVTHLAEALHSVK